MKQGDKNSRSRPGIAGISAILAFTLLVLISLFWIASWAHLPAEHSAGEDAGEYDREGFITPDLYRVVIVKPRDSANISLKYVKRSAKSRALISLQKYIVSNNGTISQNTRAVLLNLINDHGKLNEEISRYKSRNVYHFDIKKPALKSTMDNLALAR